MSAIPPQGPGYRIGELVGTGGFSTVWAAERDGRPLVLKVGRSGDPALAARFAREAAALARIGAPHAPELIDAGVLDDGRPYLALERVAGAPLDIAAAVPVARAVALVDALLVELAAIHGAGVVHGDVKPGNLLVAGPGDVVRLVDFGQARAPTGADLAIDDAEELAGITSSHAVVVTPVYAAPERLRPGAAVDPRSDLYAAGVVLYELLAGRPPFTGDARAVERGHLLMRPPSLGPRGIPRALRELVRHLLAKRPDRRPPSAEAARAALARAREDITRARAAVALPIREPDVPVATPPRPASAEPESRVLLAIDGVAPPREIDALARGARSVVVRRSGTRSILTWPAESDDPVSAAREVARAARDRFGARVALHVDHVLMRRRRDGAWTAYGAALDDPAWIETTREEDDGVAVTSAVAALAPLAVVAPPLVGRGELVAAVVAAAERDLAGAGGMMTVIGEPGTGKSRIGREVAAQLGVPVIEVAVRGGAAAGPSSTRLAAALGIDLDETADRLTATRRLADGLVAAAARPLAVIIDDIDAADDILLDAVEDAAMASPRPLWILALGGPALHDARPLWGRRLEHHQQHGIGDLDEDDAMSLAAALLYPVEYVPAAALRTLVAWCGRRPRPLCDAARWLARDGAIRRGPTGAWQLAVDRLDALSASPVGDWLASRRLAGLPPDVAALARVCAALEVTITLDDVETVQDALEERVARHPATMIDASVGLDLLVADGLLVSDERGFAFASQAIGDAIRAATPAGELIAIHGAAHAVAAARGDAAWIARHAAAGGDPAAAAAAWLVLGSAALDESRFVDAERCFTRVVELVPPGSQAAVRAHIGRGRARALQSRTAEALADLEAVVAAAGDDDALRADALLEIATTSDLACDVDGARRAMHTAEPLVLAIGDPDLTLRLRLAQGRDLFRRDEAAAATAVLGEVIAEARGRDPLTATIALLLASAAQLAVGRLDAAESSFAEVLALCSRRRDGVHAAAAHAIRVLLWEARGDIARAVGDLRESIRLAREAGHPSHEAMATHNLAELLFWAGDDDESLTLARRALWLHERFTPVVPASSVLLLARIHAARGDGDATAYLAQVASRPDDSLSPTVRLLRDALTGARATAELLDAADRVAAEEHIEVLYWILRALQRAGVPADPALSARAAALVEQRPIWRRRLAGVVARVD